MKNQQHEEAKNLYFQSDLTKTEIAARVGVSRKTLLFWAKKDNWDKLKMSARNTPSLVAERCYYILDQFTSTALMNGVAYNTFHLEHAKTIHLLASSIKKLKNRSTTNESMEMFNFFLEGLKRRKPELAELIAPQIEEYIESRADLEVNDYLVEGFNSDGSLPFPEKEFMEKQQDDKEYEEVMKDFEQFLEAREAEKSGDNPPADPSAPVPESPAPGPKHPRCAPLAP